MTRVEWLMAFAAASILGLCVTPTAAVSLVPGWITKKALAYIIHEELMLPICDTRNDRDQIVYFSLLDEENPVKYTLELYIICDNYCSANQGAPDRTRDFIINAVNVASRSMKQLNLELIIVGLDIWNDYGWTNWTTPKQNMAPQYNWLGSQINYYLRRSYFDELILLSGIQLGYAGIQGDIEGFNTKGCISNSRCDGIISLSLRSSTQSLGVVIAHELGHALNMDHDNSGCSCSNGQSGCIMASSVNEAKLARPTYSSCSISAFEARKNSSNGIALRKPLPPADAMIGRSRCGNGIIEDGEQCDCGPACLPDGCCKCCNNCQLVNGAQCAFGMCCNTAKCKFIAAGTLCRRSRDEFCDSNDFCSGSSIECKNTYLADWTDCNDFANETGYCKGGFCNTINVQCRFVWNSAFRGAADNCFKNAIDSSQKTSTSSYYKCQTLICDGKGSTSGIPSGRNLRRTKTSKNEDCATGNYLQMESSLLGLSGTMVVEDGTKCGTDSACFAGQCISKASAKSQIQSKPEFQRDTQYCGNGRVEAGEDCDCGPMQCSCCDLNTCKFKAVNTPCLDSCGLCSGNSANCATQGSAISDFKQCKGNNNNMCYRGSCVNLDSTCQAHFIFAAAADFLYLQNVGQSSATFNSGGFLAVDNSNGATVYEEYRAGEDTGICGIVQCSTMDSNGFYYPPGNSSQKTSYPVKNFALTTANNRVMYYQPRSSQTLTVPNKGSKTVKIFYPLIADEGTPCMLANNKDGYCRTLEAQSTGIPSITYYYSKCTEIPSSPPNSRYQFYPFN